MSEQEIYLATKQDILHLASDLQASILHYMALVRILVLFIVALPFNVALFVLTHALVLLVSVLQDMALIFIKGYLDFMNEARRAKL